MSMNSETLVFWMEVNMLVGSAQEGVELSKS